MIVLFSILLIITSILESVFPIFPITFVVLFLYTIMKHDHWVFPLALGSGVLLDMLLLRSVGETALYFIILLFFILLYQRKYEIRTVPFVMVSSFISSLFLSLIFGYSEVLLGVSLSVLITLIGFVMIQLFVKSAYE